MGEVSRFGEPSYGGGTTLSCRLSDIVARPN